MIAVLTLAVCLSQGPIHSPLPDENPLALNAEIKQFLDENIDRATDGLAQLRQLVDLIFDRNGINFTYQPVTRSAIETFTHHGGNCISFTYLVIAMSRYLGLDARFREVDMAPIWSEVESIVSVDGHADAAISIGGRWYFADLLPGVRELEVAGRIVSDNRAIAHFWSNRGVECLTAGHPNEAVECFDKALQNDPQADFAWANMGVAKAARGSLEQASHCYQEALRINKGDMTAMANLVSLYERMGRVQDARRFQAKVKKFNEANPYYHYRLGLLAYQSGRYLESVAQLRTALKLKRSDHYFYRVMAQDYVQLGELQKARECVELAMKNAPDVAWKVRYNEKLQWLTAHLPHS